MLTELVSMAPSSLNDSILIIGNCQMYALETIAIAHKSFSSVFRVNLADKDSVENNKHLFERIKEFRHIFTQPILSRQYYPFHTANILKYSNNVSVLPNIFFDGFHPDICYVGSHGKRIASPIGDYHLSIVLGCFLNNIPQEQVIDLYSKSIYEALGFFSRFSESKSELNRRCSINQAHLGTDWLWERFDKCKFMHTINHPKLNVLQELSILSLRRVVSEISYWCVTLPVDILMLNSAIIPSYGFNQDLLDIRPDELIFKSGQSFDNRFFNLGEYIDAAYAKYSSVNRSYLIPRGANANIKAKIQSITQSLPKKISCASLTCDAGAIPIIHGSEKSPLYSILIRFFDKLNRLALPDSLYYYQMSDFSDGGLDKCLSHIERYMITRGAYLPSSIILLDICGEGPHPRKTYVEKINEFACKYHMNPLRIILVSQNILTLQKARIVERILKLPKVVNWSYYDFWAHRMYEYHSAKYEGSIQRSIDCFSLKRNKLFTCLNYAPRPHRFALISRLAKQGLLEEGYVSFNLIPKKGSQASLELLTSNSKKLYPSFVEDINYFLSQGNLNIALSLDLDREVNLKDIVLDIPWEICKHSSFFVVTETSMTEGETLRISEKSLKPIISGMPFLIAGEPRVLEFMKSMGIQSFHEYIDESYDCISNRSERLSAICSSLEQLRALKYDNQESFFDGIGRICVENQRYFLSGSYQRSLEAAFVSSLSDAFASIRLS